MRIGSVILAIILFIFFSQFSLLSSDISKFEELSIRPNPQIQAQIKSTVFAKTSEERLKEFSNLKEMENLDYLIQQLMYFQLEKIKMHHNGEIASQEMEKATYTADFIICQMLAIDEKTMTIPYESAQNIINAVLPYLKTKDRDFREILYIQLARVDSLKGSNEKKIDYTAYQSYIENQKANPPLTLIQYMYRKPDKALSTLTNIYMEDPNKKQALIQKKEIIDTELKRLEHLKRGEDRQVKPEVVSVLNELSQDKDWWVRLYVAEIVSKESGFATPELISRLEQDSNPLVTEVMERRNKREEINKRRKELEELTLYLISYTDELGSSDTQLERLIYKAKQLTGDYYFKFTELEVMEENLKKVEERFEDLIPLVKEALTNDKISFKEFILIPLKEEYVSDTNKKFIIKEYLTDSKIIEKAKKEEKDELKGVLESLSPKIPEAKEVLKTIR